MTTTGGSGEFTYSLDGGIPQASNVFSGLSAGEYTVTVIVNDDLGCSISDTLTIGTIPDTSAPVTNEGTSGWGQAAGLLASDAESLDAFGSYVAIAGDYAIVGAPDEDTGGTDAGAAYIFKRIGGIWQEQAKIQSSDS